MSTALQVLSVSLDFRTHNETEEMCELIKIYPRKKLMTNLIKFTKLGT